MNTLNKSEKIAVAVGILVVGFFFVFGATVVNILRSGTLSPAASTPMNDQTNGEVNTNPQATTTPGTGQTQTLANGLIIQDTTVGSGDVAQPGDTVTVNYVGTFTNGKVFDSSVARNQPFSFVLGAGQVIQGWDQGVVGMKVGGTRILTVPSSLGYGPNDYGPIPGNSTLVFEVQLLKVQK